ncbi:hypothetical protein BJV78DRAFT_1361119, partial [Lactifluus subvellereus]
DTGRPVSSTLYCTVLYIVPVTCQPFSFSKSQSNAATIPALTRFKPSLSANGTFKSTTPTTPPVSFTGSENVGRIVGRNVQSRFGKVLLELGGNKNLPSRCPPLIVHVYFKS